MKNSNYMPHKRTKIKVRPLIIKSAALALCCTLVISSAACGISSGSSSSGSTASLTDVQKEFDEYCEALFVESLEGDALTAHYTITNPSDYGLSYSEEDYTFGDISLDDTESGFDDIRTEQENLKSFDRSELTSTQKQTYDTLEDYFEIQLAYEGTSELESIFAPQYGIIPNLYTNLSEFTFYEKDDTDLYLALVKDTKRYIEQCIEFARQQSEDGYFMSEDTAEESIEECEKHYNNDASVLVDGLESRLEGLNLTDSEKQTILDTNKEYVNNYYLPAIKEAKEALEELKSTGKNSGGLCGYGDLGKQYYTAIVMDNTSSTMTPDELIKYLENSYTTVLMGLASLSSSDYTAYSSYDTGLSSADDVLEFLLKNVGTSFPTPVATNYTASYMDESSKSDNVSAYYVTGRIDDTSINTIKINPDYSSDDSLGLYTTLAHEGYPGHLYQLTAFNSNEEVSNVRKILSFTGMTEGWAQYAAKCALDYLDTSDGVKELAYANDILGYIIYSRIDAGVNYEGWSYSKTKLYLQQSYGSITTLDDSTLTAIADEAYGLAVSNPGCFLPYTVGYLKFVEMRDKAEQQLGSSFDETEYHSFLIELGTTSLDVCEKALDMWLEYKS